MGKYRAKSMMSVRQMFEYTNQTFPKDRILITDETIINLTEYLVKQGAVEYNGNVPDIVTLKPGLFVDGNVTFPDLEVRWKDTKNTANNYWDIFRVLIFPDYQQKIQSVGEDHTIIGFLRLKNIILPLAVSANDLEMGFGDIFNENGEYMKLNDPEFVHSNNYTLRDLLVSTLSVWYELQVFALLPETKNVFQTPTRTIYAERKNKRYVTAYSNKNVTPIRCYLFTASKIPKMVEDIKGKDGNFKS